MAKIKIKLSKNILIIAAILVIIVSSIFYSMFFVPRPLKTWNYKGLVLTFRSDLREANKVPVYPGETQVYLDTMHPLVKNVTIAYKDVGEYGYYATEAFEITYKMRLAYMNLVGSEEGSTFQVPPFDVESVEQYAHLPGKIQNPIIALVHPIYANETAVRNEGHVTYISGETCDELDLATTKFLMIVLGIELE